MFSFGKFHGVEVRERRKTDINPFPRAILESSLPEIQNNNARGKAFRVDQGISRPISEKVRGNEFKVQPFKAEFAKFGPHTSLTKATVLIADNLVISFI